VCLIAEQTKLERQKEEKQFNKQRDTFVKDTEALTKLTNLQNADTAKKTDIKSQVDALTKRISTYQ
jgi:DNA/RNA endonuclease G (NUC1)